MLHRDREDVKEVANAAAAVEQVHQTYEAKPSRCLDRGSLVGAASSSECFKCFERSM
eukprot:SAG25_NODE_1514_length_2862_cov_1.655085_2_plen_57_part_00